VDIKGIKFVGPVLDQSGYAKASRENILSLYKLGVPLTVSPISFEHAKPDLGESGKILNSLINKNIDYNIVIMQCTPEFYSKYREEGKVNIGYTVWETTALHPDWKSYINTNVDACMVACEWNVSVFKNSGVTVPVISIPHVVEVTTQDDVVPYDVTSIKENAYVFYNINQFTERKNILSLIKTYWRTFRNGENVALVLKTYRNDYSDTEKDMVRDIVRRLKIVSPMKDSNSYPPIYLVLDVLSEDGIKGLHKRCDCYVTMDRGEGFGLSSATAGAFGNPLIATGFGGVTEYAKLDNSYLVDFVETSVCNMPWCVLPGNKVVSFGNRKVIESLSLDDELLSQSGGYYKPKKIWSRETSDEQCFEIKAQGEAPFSVTKNHIIPVFRAGSRVELKASEIEVGDYLIKEIDSTWATNKELKISDFIDVSNYTIKDGFYYPKSGPSTGKRITRDILQLDRNFGKLLGYYLAEGNASIEKRSVFFNFNYKENASHVCEELLKNVFGTELTISRLDRIERHVGKTRRTESRISIFSSMLARLLKKLCGSYSYAKHFDNKFLSMFNKEFTIGVLEGLFEGDGHAQVNGRNGIYIALSNERLISSIKELLCKLSVYSSLRLSKKKGEGVIRERIIYTKDSWSLEITGSDKITFGKLLGYNTANWESKCSYRKYINNRELFLLPIQKIKEFSYTGEVFDIDMGGDHPYYNLNGFLIHNSPWYGLEQYWATASEKHASELMTYVFEHQEEAKITGLQLQSDIKNNLSYEVIGNKIIDAIRGL